MNLPVIVIGAGGHATVVADALLASGRQVLGLTDPGPARHGRHICGIPVLGDDSILKDYSPAQVELANGLGSLGGEAMSLRRRVQEKLEAAGWQFCNVRHPAAIVSPFARVDATAQLMAGCVVQPGAIVGKGVIVNTAAVVEHDVTVGAWSHIAPCAVVCGDVRIDEACHVGAGAVVRQGVALGPVTLAGAGAVVIKSFAGNGTLVGVPARPIEGSE
jgi:sugar O-acyltransferase (sialic acid O-acetyltransferase NeuD family)